MEKKELAKKTIAIFKKSYPNAKYYLNFETPAQLVIAAILSAQCRDEFVNEATAELFTVNKRVSDFEKLSRDEFMNHVYKVTYASNKVKYIMAAIRQLQDEFNGEIPKTVEELASLPGIGKKTANTILTNAFDIVQGIVVDTHVIKVGNRLGLVDTKNADKIERELREIIPKKDWKKVQWWFKTHGRAVCKKPIPTCSKCPIEKLCPKIGVKKHY